MYPKNQGTIPVIFLLTFMGLKPNLAEVYATIILKQGIITNIGQKRKDFLLKTLRKKLKRSHN